MNIFSASTKENFMIALRAIRSNILRAILTILIISVGIMALVAMNTFVEAFKGTMNSQFSKLGTGTIVVSSKRSSRNHSNGIKEKAQPPVTYNEVMLFKKKFDGDALVSVSSIGSFMATAKFKNNKTNPNIRIIGCDENYLELSSYEIDKGRNFSSEEVVKGTNSVILGSDLIESLFKQGQYPLDKYIYIGADKYYVVGTLKSKGSTFGMANDNQIIITLGSLKKRFHGANSRYSLSIKPNNIQEMDDLISSIHGLMRLIRKDDIHDSESFIVTTSDKMTGNLNSFMDQLSIAATIIGLITLMGAGIGLLNIMLVSVTERTREIGVRKAIGASAKQIQQQFLIEAIVIGQIGGVIGSILGVVIGNVIAIYMDFNFQIPWFWIILGVVLTFFTSVLSGYMPAKKASRLDPIEALRYE